MKLNIFTYGSLMFPSVWQSVVKNRYRAQPAWVANIARYQLIGERYPAAIDCQQTMPLFGVLYSGVTPADLKRLDKFEGKIYYRQAISAYQETQYSAVPPRITSAYVYLLRPRFYSTLSKRAWHPKRFSRYHLKAFARQHTR